nr:ATP-binding protein [Halorubellus salinus]
MAAAGSEAATADSSVAAGAEADAATDDVADDDGTASPSSPAVGEIVERIERLDETAAAADDATATNATDDREATPTRGERFGGSNPESDAADLGLDDELGAAFDAAATVEEPDVTPSDVPDVEAILAETEFDDVEEVEFATAEFYDRVGFETDSSTGAFVSAFDEAFTDDALGVDVDQVRVDADAATTIDPDLLDRATPAPDSGTSSLDAVREVTLDVDEADELLELTEELVVDTQRLAGALPELPPDAADALASLRDVSARIEDQVSNVRLVPLDDAFSGLSRTSRRVARSQDKEVTFLTENGDVEVDRQVVDELADPLVHLVRNAVDHGIEPPDERVEKGKESEGTVLVRAERDGDTVTVAVEDDGRGVAPDDLRAAAVEAGLYTEAEAAALDRDDALALMFDAGLSTTTEVTEVSGRGVGLDVVSDVATRLEGTLDVTSEPDVGTTVELTLPVSVALSEVLTVSVGPRRFGLPATEIRRVEEFAPERVDGETYRLLTGEDTQERVPIVDLADELDVDPAAASTPAYTDVVVLTDGPNPRALRCQDVRDWESVVVQSFDGVLRDHERARGAALAGDGTPVVVLEPAALGGNR